MGTNYYFRRKIGEPCEHCGRVDESEDIHIGKSSHGWRFCFTNYNKTIHSYKDWLNFFENNNGYILNEYNKEVTLDDFISMVECKQDDMSDEDYFKQYPKHSGSYDYYYKDYHDEDGYRFKNGEFS